MAFASLLALPERLRVWPLPLVIPLVLYGIVVTFTRPLRRTVDWLRRGRLTPPIVAWTCVIVGVSSGVLVLYQALRSPDLEHLDAYVPLGLLGHPVITAIVFCLVNATLEEVIFRGILYQAFEARWSWRVAVLASAVAFGIGHVGGYPPGIVGGVLAGVYALALGTLRHHAGGLLAVILAHVFADATITAIRVYVS